MASDDNHMIQVPITMWNKIIDDLSFIREEVQTMKVNAEAGRKIAEEHRETLAKHNQEMERLARGFLNDDPEAHMREHKASQDMRQIRIDIVKDIIKKSASGGFFLGIGYLFWALWEAIKLEMRK